MYICAYIICIYVEEGAERAADAAARGARHLYPYAQPRENMVGVNMVLAESFN